TWNSSQIARLATRDREMFENGVVTFPIEIIRESDGKLLSWSGGLGQNHDALGVWIRKRPEQDRVNDAKDGGVRADAERERQDRNCSKGRLFRERSHRIAEV